MGRWVSFVSRCDVTTRAERRAETAPSRMLAFESRTAEKMTSKKVCTCWKKNVGIDSANSRRTST